SPKFFAVPCHHMPPDARGLLLVIRSPPPILDGRVCVPSIASLLNLCLPCVTKVVKVGAKHTRGFCPPRAALCVPKYGARPSLRTTTSARELLHASRRREPACLLPSLFTSSPRGASARPHSRTRLVGLTLLGTGPPFSFHRPSDLRLWRR